MGVKAKNKKSLLSNQMFIITIALFLLYAFFAVMGNRFFTYDTLLSIFDASYYIGYMAIGVTFIIITGGIDLSLGTNLIFSAMVGVVAFKKWGLPLELCLLLSVIAGTLVGLVNGLLVARFKLPPFIATLGTTMITLGLSAIVSNITTLAYPPRTTEGYAWFKNIFDQYQSPDGSFKFPTGLIFLALFILASHLILKKTKIGRYTYAIGSNEEAVRLSGVNVQFWKTIPYVICGFMCGFGGVVFGATYSTITPSSGQGFELDAITGVVIGGTSLSGGVGGVIGTIIGVLIMSVLKVGLPSMQVQQQYQKLFTGLIVIIAVLMDAQQAKKRG